MSKIYISGPISGISDYRARFDVAAQIIRSKGHEAINPCDLNTILNPATTTWEQFILADLGLLRACSAICLIEGWENSRGSRMELREAQRLGMVVYKSPDNVPEGKEVEEDG